MNAVWVYELVELAVSEYALIALSTFSGFILAMMILSLFVAIIERSMQATIVQFKQKKEQ